MAAQVEESYKLYKTRWLVLGLFIISSVTSFIQWSQYSIIADVIVHYYDVSYEAVNWSAMIYLLLYTVLILPGMHLMNKIGLRKSLIMAMVGTTLGAWIKMGSVERNRFSVVLLGQSIVAISQVFLLSFPAPLSAVWFGCCEVSTACSIGVFGIQLGVAMSFLLPPVLVNCIGDNDTLEKRFYLMNITIASACTVMLILVVFFFQDKPETPPSYAQLQLENEKSTDKNYAQSLKRLFTHPSFVFLFISYGINVGVFYAVSTLLNQIVLKYYAGASEDAGRIGLTIVVAGMIGSLVCGYGLDKFNQFKLILLGINSFSLIGMITFTFILTKGIVYVYILSAVIGFFLTGLIPIGFDVAAEITFPEPECTTAGLLTASSQIFGIAFTYLYSYLLRNFGNMANYVMSFCLFLSVILTIFMRFELKRRNAEARDKTVT